MFDSYVMSCQSILQPYLYTLLARRDARLVPLEDVLPGVGPAPEAVVVHVEGVVVLPRQHPGEYLQCVCQTDRPNEIRGKLLQSQKFKSVNSYHLRYFVLFPLLDSSAIGISPSSEKLVCSYGTENAL